MAAKEDVPGTGRYLSTYPKVQRISVRVLRISVRVRHILVRVRRISVMVRRISVRVRRISVRVRRISVRVRRISVASVSACRKEGPSSILGSAPQGGFSYRTPGVEEKDLGNW